MQPVLNVEDVKSVEQALTLEGVSLAELMRRAGHAAAQEALDLGGVQRVVVLVGLGNNGGDGWVAAELMRRAHIDVTVVCAQEPQNVKSQLALMVASSAVKAGVPYVVAPSQDELANILATADVVIDAMLGTGFHGEPQAPFSLWIEALNASGVRVVAVDVPSGLSAQTGHAPGACVLADVTVTMIALKPGLLADAGRDACGRIVVAPLAEQTARLVRNADPVAWRVSDADYLDVLEPPTANVDKYSRGSVLVVAGSSRFAGAAVLVARAAARAGAGYVTLAVPACIATVCRTHLLEIPVVPLPATQEGTIAKEARPQLTQLAKRASSVLVGPGLGVDVDTVAVVGALLEVDVPLVIDADGLNCLAQLTSGRLDNFPELIRREAPLILTPHARELARLVGLADTPPTSLTARLEAARRSVWADGGSALCVVAKGTATACVGVDIALVPAPGPAALATAGTGDVLAGILASLLAQTSVSNDALVLLAAYGCELHAQAALRAQTAFGSRGMMAGDVIDGIGLAYDEFAERVMLANAEDAQESEA
jgi:NAD(P)H-hydrate epimerase